MGENQLNPGDPLRITVAKYSPDLEDRPHHATYEVPYTREMRILEALDYIVEELGESLAYQWFCGVKKCGMCGMRVNGRPVLACWEAVEPEMLIEPIANFPVVRDLVVDMSPYQERMLAVEPWMQRTKPYPGFPEQLTPSEMTDAAKAGRCIECLLCTSACPSYAADADVFSGPTVMTQLARFGLDPRDEGPRAQHAIDAGISACVTCGACTAVCPVEIPIANDILKLRRLVTTGGEHDGRIRAEATELPRKVRLGLRAFRSRRLVGLGVRALAILSRPFRRGGTTHVPWPRRLVSWRLPPAVPFKPARTRLRTLNRDKPIANTDVTGRRVMLFMQCLSDRLAPDIAVSTARLLQAAGAHVVVPRDQHCCGLPAFDVGDWETARQMAAATIEAFEGADDIVTPAPSCLLAMMEEYETLFEGDPVWTARAKALRERVHDLVGYLAGPARLPNGSLDTGERDAVTVHRFCQSGNLLGRGDEMADLVRDLRGDPVRPLPENGVCCGFGGSTSLAQPEVSERILARKLECVDQTGATTLVTDNPGCVLHMRGGGAASKRDLRVLHLAEYLARGLDGRS